MEIAIIGAGLAGANILKTIIESDRLGASDRINVYEKRDQLGPGFPYEEDSPVKMLNIPHEEISLGDGPGDFSKWLEENYQDPINFEGLASRVACGYYIEERMAKYFNHNQVGIIDDEVIGLDYRPKENTYEVSCKESASKVFDAVFLCIGHPIYNDFYDLLGHENYIHDPYPLSEKLGPISQDKTVGIIGSGPTGIDIYRYLAQEKSLATSPVFLNQGDLLKLSGIELDRDHILPFMSWDWIKNKKKENAKGLIALDSILEIIGKDLSDEGIDIFSVYDRAKDMGINNQKKILEDNDQEVAFLVKYFEELVEFYPFLYGSLSGMDRLEFKDKYEPLLNVFRSFNPQGTNSWLIEEIESENALFLDGLEEIVEDGDGFIAKGKRDMDIDIIVNATGFNQNLVDNLEGNSLLRDLYNQNIIMADANGQGINVNWPECQVLNKKYGLMDNLYVQGMWIANTHYRCNDLRSILAVSEFVANSFMDRIS